jgi:hypothetical protein
MIENLNIIDNEIMINLRINVVNSIFISIIIYILNKTNDVDFLIRLSVLFLLISTVMFMNV